MSSNASRPEGAAEETASFLARHPPFAGLDGAALESIAASVEQCAYRAGEIVLVEASLTA